MTLVIQHHMRAAGIDADGESSEEEEEWEDAAEGKEVEVEVDAAGLASLKELGADGADAALEDVPLGKRKRGQKAAAGARPLVHIAS